MSAQMRREDAGRGRGGLQYSFDFAVRKTLSA